MSNPTEKDYQDYLYRNADHAIQRLYDRSGGDPRDLLVLLESLRADIQNKINALHDGIEIIE